MRNKTLNELLELISLTEKSMWQAYDAQAKVAKLLSEAALTPLRIAAERMKLEIGGLWADASLDQCDAMLSLAMSIPLCAEFVREFRHLTLEGMPTGEAYLAVAALFASRGITPPLSPDAAAFLNDLLDIKCETQRESAQNKED